MIVRDLRSPECITLVYNADGELIRSIPDRVRLLSRSSTGYKGLEATTLPKFEVRTEMVKTLLRGTIRRRVLFISSQILH